MHASYWRRMKELCQRWRGDKSSSTICLKSGDHNKLHTIELKQIHPAWAAYWQQIDMFSDSSPTKLQREQRIIFPKQFYAAGQKISIRLFFLNTVQIPPPSYTPTLCRSLLIRSRQAGNSLHSLVVSPKIYAVLLVESSAWNCRS